MSPASRTRGSKAHKDAVDFSEQRGVKFSVKLSGNAAVAVLFKGNKTWTANCADCARLSSSETNDDVKDVIFKTKDHNFQVAKEERIQRKAARSVKLPTQMVLCNLVRSSRLTGKSVMGMTRSLGDGWLKNCGVVAALEVVKTEVDPSSAAVLAPLW